MKRPRFKYLLAGLLLVSLTWGFATVRGETGDSALEDSEWVLQTRIYVSNKSGTWDAYVLNKRTGELFFVNQDKKTLVTEGRPKGAQ